MLIKFFWRYLTFCGINPLIADNRKGQTTVSNCISKFTAALLQYKDIFINLPLTGDELDQISSQFEQLTGFPGVILTLDGTHVRIQQPGGERGLAYYNRKGYCSINTLVASDANSVFKHVDATMVGSAHDSRIFRQSEVNVLKLNALT